MKIVYVSYPTGNARDESAVIAAAENALGLRPFLEEHGHELAVLHLEVGDAVWGG
ncbi:hypothetical protein [Actinopolyspora saharensis]|uniref:hypothetical protein n=1 Tax=Actinopolyspora saharensis TaxID=995062 RepID=UPI003F66F1B7